MKKTFRLFSVVVAVLLVFGVVGKTGAPVAKAAGAVQLTLEGWASSDAENKLLQQIIDGFNKANDGKISVKLNQVPDYDTTLAKDLASGTPPDVFYVDEFRLKDLVKAGALAPVGDKMTNVDDFYPSLKDAFTYNGQFYCAPKDFSTLALEVNTEMLDKAGVKIPTTWDELKAAAKALTTKDVAGIVLSADMARLIAFVYQAGGAMTDDAFTKPTVNTPEFLAALKFYTGLYTDGYAKTPADLGAGWNGEAFSKGKAAMAVEGNWMVPFMQQNAPNLKYKIVELPAGPKGKATMAFTVCYAVAAKSANPDAALTLATYLTGPEGMKAWTDLGLAMPTRKSLRDGWAQKFPDQGAFLAGSDYAHKWQFVPGWNAVLDQTNAQIQNIFAGQQTPEDAVKEIEKTETEVLSGAQAPMAATATK
ncbi:MAG TPA: ABC transporter substrate-binding protein [Aggregatilineaceae bacterium]|nr:ABC transporter substrate-binding protein [Aggregatilineaceae bacterium]